MFLLLLVLVSAPGCTKPNNRVEAKSSAVSYGGLDCSRTYLGVLSWDTAIAEEQPIPHSNWPSFWSDLHCSASYLGNGWILTAAHCIISGKQYGDPRAIALNGRWYPLVQFCTPSDAGVGGSDSGAANCHPTAKVHPNYNHNLKTYDIALLRIDNSATSADTGTGTYKYPEQRTDGHQVWPITVSGSTPAAFGRATVVGHSSLFENGTGWTRRFRHVRINNVTDMSISINYYTTGDPTVKGDSGGATVALEGGVEKIIGVHSLSGIDANAVFVRGWIDSECGGCLSLGSTAPNTTEDRVSAFCYDDPNQSVQDVWKDNDGDKVPEWKDNCPNTPNADQRNCGYWDDDIVLYQERSTPIPLGHAQQLGDACDPNPCIDLQALIPVNGVGGSNHYLKTNRADVTFRATGYPEIQTPAPDAGPQGSQHTTMAGVRVEYCACHDPTLPPETAKATPRHCDG